MLLASSFTNASARLFWTALAIAILSHPAGLAAQEWPSKDPNAVIVSILENEMPVGGGYSASSAATRSLQSAARVQDGKLEVEPKRAPTTYCSGATYLVFLRAIEKMMPGSTLSGNLADTLAIKGQPDGVGVWGRWNANGPGTACLFYELEMGRNFTSFQDARRGDFMKIFWSEAVGRREHGHSVIFLETDSKDGLETVTFWSSNIPGGYGKKTVPRSKISHVIFSRLERPANIRRALNLAPRNTFLASLLSTDSSISEALTQAGAR